ncbi:MAG: hypothetical protein ACRDK0_13815, partial [Solirubrobacteraceae bacterium]
ARSHTEPLAAALAELGQEELASAGRRRDAIFMQQGITFDAGGPEVDGPVRDRPFPLDLVPRVTTCASTSWSDWCGPTRRWARWSAWCR